jgi:DHA1 family multidrug resistance protein-like MFS transporter
VVGRSLLYLITTFLAAMANNFAGLLVLSFLQGFSAHPALLMRLLLCKICTRSFSCPTTLAWVSAAYCGPVLGPLISGFAVTTEGWRRSQWEIFWVTCPTQLLMFALLPETSNPSILLRRAARLRRVTGDGCLLVKSENPNSSRRT